MKKLTSIFLALCLLTILCLPANATAARLTDEADLLTASEAATLEAKLDEISTRQGVDIVIVTVESTYGEEPRDFADDWFDYNDYGLDINLGVTITRATNRLLANERLSIIAAIGANQALVATLAATDRSPVIRDIALEASFTLGTDEHYAGHIL